MYTYAFCKTFPTPLKLPEGMTALVQTATADQLSAVIEPVSLEHLQQNDTLLVQAVLAHDRVIRSLFLQTTILPLRFGTSFSSLEGLLAHLHKHQQTYLSQLTRLEGKAEYMLKLTPVEVSELLIAPEVRGKDYFLAKKQQYQDQLSYQEQQQAAMRQIEQVISQSYPQHHFSEAPTGDQAIYLLIESDRELQLRQHIQTLQQPYPQWQLSLGDALPPYHFVTGSAESPHTES